MLSAASLLLIGSILCSLRLDQPGSFPKPLSAKEERFYLEKAAQGDLNARNTLIERNLRLVAHIMKKYYAQTADHEDLLSIGTIGLIKGIETFDLSKGARLATYAARCVENEILMYFRSQKKTAGDISLSDAIETGKDGTSLAVQDVVASDEDLFEDLARREDAKKLRKAIESCLTDREQRVVRMRYGFDGLAPQRQQDVAAQLGISRSYVSRIEKKALEKLRAALEESRFQD